MNKLLSFILNRPVTTAMFFLMILVLGISAFIKIPLELNPRIDLPKISISTSWYGTSPETMEALITAPIEEIAATIRGVKNISSESERGSSIINLEFQEKTDITLATLELNEKLSYIAEQFPAGVFPSISKYSPKQVEEQRFMTFSIASNMEESTLKKIALEKIKPALLSITGVSDVKALGGLSREIKILLDENKMKGFGLTLNKVISGLDEVDVIKNAGISIEKDSYNPIIIRQEINSLIDIENIPVKISSNKTVKLGSFAQVLDGSEGNRMFRRINGEPTITLEIIKEPGKNVMTTADEVDRIIDKFTLDIPEIKFRKVYDQSIRLRDELNSLTKQSLISFCGVFLVLLLFLRNFKAPLIILFSIIYSILTVILLFSFLGVTLNILTLSGLSLGIGMLVDNSIVVYENIEYHRKRYIKLKDAVKIAVSEVSAPLLASTLTTAVVFIPFFFLPEELRKMFLFFGLGMGLSIIISLIFSLTFIPFIAAGFTKKNHILDNGYIQTEGSDNLKTDESYNIHNYPKEKKLSFNISKYFEKLVSKSLRFRWIIIGFSIWLLGIPLWILPDSIDTPVISNFYNNTIGSEFFQNKKELFYKIFGGSWYIFNSNVNQNDFFGYYSPDTYLQVYLESEQGTDIKVLNEINKKVEKILSNYSQYLTSFNTSVYENYSSMSINFKNEYADSEIPLILKSSLMSYFTEFGGIHATIVGYGQPFSGGASFFESSSQLVRFYGYNYNQVKELAYEFKQRVEQNPRVENVNIDKSGWGRSIYEIVVTVERSRISAHGLTVNEVLNVVRSYTGGRTARKSLLINGERISFEIKFKGYDDFQISDLLNTSFLDRTGKPVNLKDLIKLERVKTLSSIMREKQQYSRTVSLDFLGPYDYAQEYITAVVRSIKLPYGYAIKMGFDGFFREKDKIAFAYMILAAVILVFMVTAGFYESFRKPLIIILSAPMALIGLFLIYYYSEVNFGKSGYAGLILLIGVAVNNAIVLIDYISKLIKKGYELDKAITEGTVRRAKPIIMTTMTTIIGLLPFVIIGDQKSLWYGLSLSVIGGLISSTLMVLLVMPGMCRIFFKRNEI